MRNGTVGNPRGEVTVFLGYDWLATSSGYLISRKEIHMHDVDLKALTVKVVGAMIESASLSEHSNELEISPSTGYVLASFSSDNETDWSVCFN